jgi:hypothetical protein
MAELVGSGYGQHREILYVVKTHPWLWILPL